MNGGKMTAGEAMRAPMMTEDDLYAAADEEAPSQMSIAKAALPREFPVGTHLILAEDMGDSFRVEIMEEESSPEPGEPEEYS